MRSLVALSAALTVFLVGCSDGASSLDEPADDVALRVVDASDIARDWTLADLESEVEFVEITIDGDLQRGPRLVDVIEASGVDAWDTGEVLGMREGRVVEVTLDVNAATVDETWLFDVTNRGTLKLAAPGLPRQQWVRDVGELRLR